MSKLEQVRESGQQVAEAIASVLNVEVEIIDTGLVRVAGTGKVRTDVGSRLLRGLVNKHVIETGRHIYINEAGSHHICLSCPQAGRCFYRASIVYPITIGPAVIGTISLIAFDERQKETLGRNTGSLIEFIGRMADLISSKVLEKEAVAERVLLAGRLEALVDAVYEGVMAIDGNGVVTHFNRSAELLFGTEKGRVTGKDCRVLFPGLPLAGVLETGASFTSKEIHIQFEGRRLHFLCTARPIRSDDGKIAGVVASFRDFRETQKLAFEMIGNQEIITFDNIIGNSRPLLEVKAQSGKIAGSSSTVLITGESGTGKEIFARAIHSAGPQGHRPFIAINCGAIPESLLESELFGYEEGAFTGARRGGKPGKFELANGGTIFLDEIGNMSLYLQAKLLRVLQDRQVERVGGTRPVPVSIRVIAATNADLLEMVRKNLFREDLYYRLSVIPLAIPPLRQRPEDIPLLLDFFLKRFTGLLAKEIQGFTERALNACLSHDWPGNVRELVNAVEYAVNLEDGPRITPASLPPALRMDKGLAPSFPPQPMTGNLISLAQLEKEAIDRALASYGWSDEGKVRAARTLGISRATIYRKIQKYRLSPPQAAFQSEIVFLRTNERDEFERL